MNAIELTAEVERDIQDSSYSQTEILSLLNQGMVSVAFLEPLPSLQKTDAIEAVTSASRVSMPADYHTRVLFVWNNTTGKECRLCYTRQTLRTMYRDETATGDIQDVAVEGDFLHYRRVPETSQELAVTYYRLPEMMTLEETSEPDGLLEMFHSQILVSYALWKLYAEVEDGMEGRKVNTAYYKDQFDSGIKLLHLYSPDVSVPRRYFPRRVQTF